jgi:hypothetical protein
MEIVRGVDALNGLPGVRVVARWNQSNWPGLVRERAPGIVRAASEKDRMHMCQLWKREHRYQSWPVLLGCPDALATEYEPPCANFGAVFAVECAYVDLSSDPMTTGAVFDEGRWFRATHSQHPPDVCKGRKVVHLPAVGVAISVYPFAMGHFMPEQLPHVMMLHRHLPPEVPIIVGNGSATRRFLQKLMDWGYVPPGRFRLYPFTGDGTVIHADTVYTAVNSHFSNVNGGDITYRSVRETFTPGGPVALEKRSHVLVIDRHGARARSIMNQADMLRVLREEERGVLGEHPRLQILPWKPNANNVSADIEAFRHAAMVVAPHGAGLSNILFLAEGTPVLEVCYDATNGMNCPAMYGAIGVNLHLPYWVVTAKGGYGTNLNVDLVQLRAAAREMFETIRATRRRGGNAGSGRGGGGGGGAAAFEAVGHTAEANERGGAGVAALVRKLKRRCHST